MYDLPVCLKFPLSFPLLIVHHLVVLRLLYADLRKEGRKSNYGDDYVWDTCRNIKEHKRRQQVAPLLY